MRAISRAVSAIENRASEAEALLRLLFPHTGRAWRVGVTGAPGTGKSTLVDRLAAHYRSEKKSVGIIAVDPSSPFTGGAILGDRVRMQGHAGDEGIFIRSMATRGYLGGLAQSTGDATLLLDAAGKDMILVETVGVGQGEIEIVRLADCTIVVLVPGMGDDVQSLKAGLMEIARHFRDQQVRSRGCGPVPGTAWRDSATRAGARRLEASGGPHHRDGESGRRRTRPPDRAFSRAREKSPDRPARELAYWKEWLLRLVETRLVERVLGDRASAERFERAAAEVAARKKDPYAAVNEILARARIA